MGSEHYAFLIEPGRDGFPALTDAPTVWGNCMDDLVGYRLAGRKNPEEVCEQAQELSELLESQLDSEDEDYEEAAERLFTAEQLDTWRRAEDIENVSVKSVMGLMPYKGDWIPMAQYLYNEPWDFDLDSGVPPEKTWRSAMIKCWRMHGVREPWKLPESLTEKADALEKSNPIMAAAIRAGLRIRPEANASAAGSAGFRLEMEPTDSEPVLWQPSGEICCFVPPFVAGHDRMPGARLFDDAHDIRIDPTQPLSDRSAILFLNLRS